MNDKTSFRKSKKVFKRLYKEYNYQGKKVYKDVKCIFNFDRCRMEIVDVIYTWQGNGSLYFYPDLVLKSKFRHNEKEVKRICSDMQAQKIAQYEFLQKYAQHP